MNRTTSSDQTEVTFTRIFNAPRALVFKAWTDPQHFAKWWGPRGFTNPVCDLDLRPGGRFRIVMQGHGVESPCEGTYHEIVENERLVMSIAPTDQPADFYQQLNQYRREFGGTDGGDLTMVNTITFEELGGGKTKMTIVTRFESAADRSAALKFGHVEGMNESLDRLEELLAGKEPA